MRNWTEHGSSQLTAISDAGSTPAASTNFFKQQRDQGPSLRSGFRLRAQTPATRLKFDSRRLHQPSPRGLRLGVPNYSGARGSRQAAPLFYVARLSFPSSDAA